MSEAPPLIAGMWGTTTLRVMLLSPSGEAGFEISAIKEGPGASAIKRDAFESILFDLITPWLENAPTAGVILAGMVGSTIGWRDVGYAACPTTMGDKTLGVEFEARGRKITIVRGLSCKNWVGEPDMLRGEETELIGWAALSEGHNAERHIVCIPGTHAKWVLVRDGVVESFVTSVAGELFAALRRSGVLVTENSPLASEPSAAFRTGVGDAIGESASLLHQLFSVRAQRVLKGLSDAEAVERLSGIIIGADVGRAVAMAKSIAPGASFSVIGAPSVAERYRLAINYLGVDCKVIDALTASMQGFWYQWCAR